MSPQVAALQLRGRRITHVLLAPLIAVLLLVTCTLGPIAVAWQSSEVGDTTTCVRLPDSDVLHIVALGAVMLLLVIGSTFTSH